MSDGRNRRVLIAEDERFIALDLADELEERGFSIAGPFRSSAAALEAVMTDTPDFAVIDVRLNDGDCALLARELRRRHVPFVFFTGDPYWAPLEQEFAGIQLVEKPAGLDEILSALLGTAADPVFDQTHPSRASAEWQVAKPA